MARIVFGQNPRRSGCVVGDGERYKAAAPPISREETARRGTESMRFKPAAALAQRRLRYSASTLHERDA